MGMPLNLVLLRHGRSEGNEANERSKKGDNTCFTDEFRSRHSSMFRLTDEGIAQAIRAGAWLRENFPEPFFRYYVSEYLRAMETAAYLDLPNARWYADFYLRERDRGDLDIATREEWKTKFADVMNRRERDGLFWTPTGGESLASGCLRCDRVLDTLDRECDLNNVIAVCHGETILEFRIRIERISQGRFRELEESDHPFDYIHNCQIIHYSRKNPETGEVEPYLNWVRSICPWNPSLSSNVWQRVVRPVYSNDDLLRVVKKYPRLVE